MSASSSSSSSAAVAPSTSTALVSKLPQNPSEWQLYFVLQRANLLQYFETFISQGGDDVQQLLEAGEEEFLEIMALVGMASKPLHVRRLQKSLQDFSLNPTPFQVAAFQKCGISPPPALTLGPAAPPSGSFSHLLGLTNNIGASDGPFSPGVSSSMIHHHGHAILGGGGHHSLNPALPLTVPNSESPGAVSSHSNGSANVWTQSLPDGLDHGLDGYGFSTLSPILTEGQIQRISDCAMNLIRTLPEFEPKLVQNKKKISRELITVMEMGPNNAGRLDEFRKYAAIYGRFDAKRKADKPLTLHEVSVNEAAAQICLHKPALLTRRDELFPMARQVVRDAGYHYVKQPGVNSRLMFRGDADDYESMLMRKRASPTESIESLEDDSPDSTGSASSDHCPPPSGTTVTAASLLNDNQHSYSHHHAGRRTKKKRCLEEIGEEMQRVSREQDTCKRRVCEAQDLTELHAIHRDLQRLTQQQMELSDEQAVLLGALRPMPVSPATAGDERHVAAETHREAANPNIKREPDSSSSSTFPDPNSS